MALYFVPVVFGYTVMLHAYSFTNARGIFPNKERLILILKLRCWWDTTFLLFATNESEFKF